MKNQKIVLLVSSFLFLTSCSGNTSSGSQSSVSSSVESQSVSESQASSSESKESESSAFVSSESSFSSSESTASVESSTSVESSIVSSESSIVSSESSDISSESTESIHTHVPDSTWHYDETRHWHVCQDCGEELEKTDHTSSGQWHHDGTKHWHVCDVCEASFAEENHSFGKYEYDSYPTPEAEGSKHRTCDCGFVETVSIPKLPGFIITINEEGKDPVQIFTDEDGNYSLPYVEASEGTYFQGFVDQNGNYVAAQGVTDKALTVTVSYSKSYFKVASVAAMKSALAYGVSAVTISDDFDIDETIYINRPLLITCEKNVTIKRASDFEGDLLVVGTDAAGNSSILDEIETELTIKPADGFTLTIDGNKSILYGVDSTVEKVKGSAIFAVDSAIVNVFDGVIFENHKKTGNDRALKYGTDSGDAQNISSPERIGGSVIVNIYSTINIYGGEFNNNEVSYNSTITDLESYIGGAIFSCGPLNIDGGSFSGNRGTYGSVAYAYRRTSISKGYFSDNRAASYGTIYIPDSQYAECLVVAENLGDIIFENNASGSSGGGFFVSSAGSLYLDKVQFLGNETSSNGGAISCKGTLTIKNSEFKNNSGGSKGGAVYYYYGDKTNETPVGTVQISNTLFKENQGPLGGALGLGSDSDTLGAKAIITDCTFEENSAPVNDGGSYGNGGAIYIQKKSVVNLVDTSFTSNQATKYGGVVYLNGGSSIIGDGCHFESNSAKSNGGAIYSDSGIVEFDNSSFESNSGAGGGAFYIKSAGAQLTLTNTSFTKNQATGQTNGGALYVYTDAICDIDGATFSENTSGNFGGAGYFSGASITTMKNVTSVGNSAKTGGFIYITTSGSVLKIFSGSTKECVAETAGSENIYSNTNKTSIYIKDTDKKTAFDYDGTLISGKYNLQDIDE